MIDWRLQKTRRREADARAPAPLAVDVRVVAFERCAGHGPGLKVWGRLHYAIGKQGFHLPLGMTWEALSRLRDEVRWAGGSWPDSIIVARCLQRWGADQLTGLYRSGVTPPPGGMTLDFGRAPFSEAPRRLLERSGLIVPVLPSAA